ncbi:MAG: hypothetical protein Q8P85_12530 [Pseudomonas sp.]|nr:hypothetical protein [Pseudomonas sp.]
MSITVNLPKVALSKIKAIIDSAPAEESCPPIRPFRKLLQSHAGNDTTCQDDSLDWLSARQTQRLPTPTKDARAMTTSTNSPLNRSANAAETDYSIRLLQSLGETTLANAIIQAGTGGDNAWLPVVAHDFSQLNDERIILIPTGHHLVSAQTFEIPRHFIGLPDARYLQRKSCTWPKSCERPTLLLISENSLENPQQDSQREVVFVTTHLSRFAHLQMDASQPTVMQFMFTVGTTRSDYLFDSTCSDRVEVLDLRTETLWEGHDWASTLGAPSDPVMRTLDQVGEAGLKAIDEIFDPLIRYAEKIERMLKSK